MAAASLAAPVAAEAHSCPNEWCSGSDSATGTNYSGGAPQIYDGEVGVYYLDIGGSGAGKQPCPSDPNYSCFNVAAANNAWSIMKNDQGVGIAFYYFGGGADSIYASNYGSNYCFGWHQAKLAVADVQKYFSTYAPATWLMFLDIEQNDNFGWSSSTKQGNQSVENGFYQYIDGDSSGDPSNCSGTNPLIMQHGVYSSPNQWAYSFGSTYGSIPNTPEWTSEWCCHTDNPSGFGSGSTQAQWFGGSNYHEEWQFNESPDHDNLPEPYYLPHWGFSIGD